MNMFSSGFFVVLVGLYFQFSSVRWQLDRTCMDYTFLNIFVCAECQYQLYMEAIEDSENPVYVLKEKKIICLI
jgi:hypothetical protein